MRQMMYLTKRADTPEEADAQLAKIVAVYLHDGWDIEGIVQFGTDKRPYTGEVVHWAQQKMVKESDE